METIPWLFLVSYRHPSLNSSILIAKTLTLNRNIYKMHNIGRLHILSWRVYRGALPLFFIFWHHLPMTPMPVGQLVRHVILRAKLANIQVKRLGPKTTEG